jgi:hypothetical protein
VLEEEEKAKGSKPLEKLDDSPVVSATKKIKNK